MGQHLRGVVENKGGEEDDAHARQCQRQGGGLEEEVGQSEHDYGHQSDQDKAAQEREVATRGEAVGGQGNEIHGSSEECLGDQHAGLGGDHADQWRDRHAGNGTEAEQGDHVESGGVAHCLYGEDAADHDQQHDERVLDGER